MSQARKLWIRNTKYTENFCMYFICFKNSYVFLSYLMPPVTEILVCTFSEELFKSNFSPSETMPLTILTRSVVHRKLFAELVLVMQFTDAWMSCFNLQRSFSSC